MNQTKKILQIDSLYRHSGVTGDLFSIDDLDRHIAWDYSLPTIVLKQPEYQQQKIGKLVESDHEFRQSIFSEYPMLQSLDFNNILIAGGFVSSHVYKIDEYIETRDIDIFIYGLDEQSANDKVKQIVSLLYNAAQGKNKYKKIELQEHVATLFLGRTKLQIIFRLYKTISEILHGFDLGSSAVGFDGSVLYFTSMSKYCFENSINIVDTTRRSLSYEYRLTKYLNRGFEIVLPGLDLKKLRTNNLEFGVPEVCALPFMIFSYSDVSQNKIVLKRLLKKNNWFNKDTNQRFTSDYHFVSNKYELFNENIKNFIRLETNRYYRFAFGPEVLNVFDKFTTVTESMVEKFYNRMKYAIHSRGRLNVEKLKIYFGDEVAKIIFEKMLSGGGGLSCFLNQITNEKIELAKEKIKLLSCPYTINWIIENPGTQLTSSFNPIIEREELWYGIYYLHDRKSENKFSDVEFVIHDD